MGDQGETQLLHGEHVLKTDPRVDAHGTIDELNSVLGIVYVLNQDNDSFSEQSKLEAIVGNLQQSLFILGTDIASNSKQSKEKLFHIRQEDVKQLEHWIDFMTEVLPPLEAFILPGSCILSAHLQHARALCRRAERTVWRLVHDYSVPIQAPMYLNRLSDTLFVMARWVAHLQGAHERVWKLG